MSRRSERTLQLALFVTSVAWFLAADTVAARAARGLSQRFALDAARPLLTSVFLLFLLALGFAVLQAIATITGEGGSGGALALAVADRVLMLENAIYSVISPEGCASIMWKDASKKQQAAAALKYTAGDVKLMGCVDDVLREPRGGTQNDPAATMAMVDEKLRYHLAGLRNLPIDVMLEQRYTKFRNIAQFYTTA